MKQASYTIFMEYRVKSEKWETFQAFVSQVKEQTSQISPHLQHKMLISEQQPRQIIEVIETDQKDLIEMIRKLRKEENSFLQSLDSHIDGGRSKLKFWVFRGF
ncbi:hypothetical protein [Risungbinella massiliensis]|uniref:hypothetical protein n=1 Tax=Risungbinella massiliensis TaxID=1329796 RepID=UPI0005CC070F|nr:hypothetical protein [Risungbinella massiliensis]